MPYNSGGLLARYSLSLPYCLTKVVFAHLKITTYLIRFREIMDPNEACSNQISDAQKYTGVLSFYMFVILFKIVSSVF